MKKFKPHPLAALYPARVGIKRESMKRSLIALGQTHPIVVLGDEIIDGNQRFDILQELGVEPKIERYTGGKSDAEILEYIIAANSERGLSDSQSAMIAAEALPSAGKEVTAEQVGAMFGVSRAHVFRAQAILKRSTKLARDVRNGSLTLSRAQKQLDRKDKTKEWATRANATALTKETFCLLVGDSAKKLADVADESVDLVAGDPPYGIGEDYHGFNDKLTADELIAQLSPVVVQCVRALKPQGAIWLMMSSRYAIASARILELAGLHRQEMVIWAESFGQHNAKFMTDAYRVIHFYTKDPNAFTFNWQDERTYIPSWRAENGDGRAEGPTKLVGNVWGVWTDRNVARVPDNAKERVPSTRVKAPNQLPVRLLERIVLLSSNVGDTVLDPWHGTGTTAVASLLHGRKYIGCELDPDVAEASKAWVKARLNLFSAEGK